MTTSIKDIRAGLATNLKQVNGSRQVTPYRKTAPTPPALMVMGFSKITRTAFGHNSFELPFMVQGVAGAPTDESAYIRLDQWLSPFGTGGTTNVWVAIEYDPTLGGKVSTTYVTKCDGEQFLQVQPGVEMLGSTWHVTIEL